MNKIRELCREYACWFTCEGKSDTQKKPHLLKTLDTVTEWQYTVWKSHENPKHNIAPAKKAPNTSFSCQSFGNGLVLVIGRKNMYNMTHIKATNPIKWVQIFPVSEWILKMLLKQDLNEGMGGRWWCDKKSLSRSHSGSSKCERRYHPERAN